MSQITQLVEIKVKSKKLFFYLPYDCQPVGLQIDLPVYKNVIFFCFEQKQKYERL